MMSPRRVALIAGVALLAIAPQTAGAQSAEMGVLLDRIERLERDIRTLNVQIARGGGTGAPGASAGAAATNEPAYARLNVRVSQMENDLRSITGKAEEMTFALNQLRTQIEQMSTDLDFRLRQLEQGGVGVSPATGGALGQPTASSAQTIPPSLGAPSVDPSAAPLAAVPQAPAQDVPGLPAGSQVLGTLTEAETAAAPTVESPAEPISEADALLAQLTGEEIPGVSPDPVAAAPSPAPSPAPAPTAAPTAPGVNVATEAQLAAPAAPQTAALPDGSPRDKYMYAFGLLRQGRYDLAAQALSQFVTDHGDDALAGNARYWLGETYYVRGAYVEAAETFLEGFQIDPEGPKAADALLKLGMSLANLDKKQEACAAFQKLRADYPAAPAGLKSTLQREWQKNGCV